MSEYKQPYDIDIVYLYFSLKSYVEKNKISNSKEILNGFYDSIRLYCKNNNIDFEKKIKNQSFVLVSPNNRNYPNFLARQLSIMDIAKIKLFLNYQKSIFNPDIFKVDSLATLVEHTVYDQIKWMSVYKTEFRINQIINWIENEKTKKKTKFIYNIEKLQWIGELNTLNQLSKELKNKGFTKKPTDFEKVFTKQIPIDWCKEPEYLTYLLHKLSISSNPQFSPCKKSKYKLAEALFYDNRTNYRKKINLSNVLYNVTTRQATKHRKLRERVESLLAQFIK